jgi:hypothetical protein
MVVLLAIHYYAKTNKRKFFVLIIILGLLVLFGGFRENVGVDTISYIRIFDTISSFGKNYQESIKGLRYEIGFIYLVSFIKTLGFLKVYSLFSIIILFNYILYFFSLKKFSPHFEISLFLLIVFYFFVRDMGILRQAIATSITIFSIIFIIDKKPYLFFLFTIFGSLFHVSALIFLPAYLIGNLRLSKNKLYIVIGLGFLLSLISTQFKNNLFYSFTNFELPFFNEPQYGESLSLFSFTFIRRAVPIFLLFIFYDKIINKIKYSNHLINLYFFGFFFALVFSDIVIYVTRLAAYYLTLEIIIYSYIFVVIKDRSLRFIFLFLLLLVALYYISNFMFQGHSLMNPYDNIIIKFL